MTEIAENAKKIPEARLHAPEQTPCASLKSFLEGCQGSQVDDDLVLWIPPPLPSSLAKSPLTPPIRDGQEAATGSSKPSEFSDGCAI